MIQRLLRLIIVLMLVLVAGSAFSQKAYITKYEPMADSLSQQYGIPKEIIFAIAIHESGRGTSLNARTLNNHFGVKGKNSIKTRRTSYKQYPSVAASYADFCRIISRKRFYPSLKGNPDSAKWVIAISKAGYSTQPVPWSAKVSATIKEIKRYLK